MQVTGHLLFTPMLSASRLHGRLHVCSLFWCTKSGVPGKVAPGKVKQLLAIDQTSDWLLAIHFVLEKVWPLVQLNVVYILTTFYQCTCNCF